MGRSVTDRPAPDRGAGDGAETRRGSGAGLYLYGVTRSRSWRASATDLVGVRYRDLQALVRSTPFRPAALDDEGLRTHQRAVESAMRRETILPAPYGVVFRDRRQVVQFLEDQYIVLDEALTFLEGHWELRLHMSAVEAEPGPELHELAAHLFTDLRRFARAALHLPESGGLLSCAFLVERTAWIEFVERADEMGASHEAITFDITGPWPPYDFVKVV